MEDKKLLRPSVMFKAMRHKVLTLIKTEAKMSVRERKCQQWQLLFQIKGYGSYIVGKGGVNTMFYTIDQGERFLLYPNDMIALIDKWIEASESTVYAIVNASNEIIKSDIPDQKTALQYKTKPGAHIVKISEGKQIKLFVRSAGLFDQTWKPISK